MVANIKRGFLKLLSILVAPINSINQTLYMNLTCKILSNTGFEVSGRPLWISPKCYLETVPDAPTLLGNRIVISHGVRLLTHDYSMDRIAEKDSWLAPGQELVHRSPVIVNDFAFIGMDSILMPGVTIGNAAVVAAGSVVTADVPPGVVVGGNPARVLSSTDDWVGRSRYKFQIESRRR